MPVLNCESGTSLWPMMRESHDADMRESFLRHVSDKYFPCVAAKAALEYANIDFYIAGHIACPAGDREILSFIYQFVDRLRSHPAKFRSAVLLFRDTAPMPEALFDRFMWSRLQALVDLDRKHYRHDPRVAPDPAAPDFSYSLKEEAFYVIGMHCNSSRPARQSVYPALVFNPHVQFESLRRDGKYEALKMAIRKRDLVYSGSVNPMLSDFGHHSEAFQYSGLQHESGWTCPLKINHVPDGNYSPA